MATDALSYAGCLEGHRDWVTCVASSYENPNMIVSGSRDKKVMVWEIPQEKVEGEPYGYARKCLGGHSGPVADVVISSDGQFALSGSWDKTLRLWDLATGTTVRTFIGHQSDVFSVAFSSDNRQIVSCARDKTIRLWNTLAECKYVISEECHTDWISAVRFSPSAKTPMIVSAGWDKVVKVWNLSNCKLRNNLMGHTGVVYTVCVSPDGSLCASGGKDATAMLWDVTDGKHLYSLDAGSTINMMAFSPKNYWLVAVTDQAIKVWDLENKAVLEEITPVEKVKGGQPWCVSLCWSAYGSHLFCGSTDGQIYVYEVCA